MSQTDPRLRELIEAAEPLAAIWTEVLKAANNGYYPCEHAADAPHLYRLSCGPIGLDLTLDDVRRLAKALAATNN